MTPQDHPTALKGQDSPSIARIYDYYLGGSHNNPADRQTADEIATVLPELPLLLRANRAFLRRSVHFLAGTGIRNFLDLGSGIPTAGNVHEIAQEYDPTARVVYVDNDPIAVAESRMLLDGNDRCAAIEGDLREPAKILSDPQVNRLLLLDLGEPVAFLMNSVLHFVLDDSDAAALVATYIDALPSGGYFGISHAGGSTIRPDILGQATETYSRSVSPMKLRSPDQLRDMLAGLELVEPGVVHCPDWRPDPGTAKESRPLPQICAVGRKP
jgi:S-adenosyl methyltransferase